MAAGITYVPPLLLEAGIEEKYMTMVLGRNSSTIANSLILKKKKRHILYIKIL